VRSRRTRELAAFQLELGADDHALPSVARGQQVLQILADRLPIPKLPTTAYFENLERLLAELSDGEQDR
jgi:hypothetical protein